MVNFSLLSSYCAGALLWGRETSREPRLHPVHPPPRGVGSARRNPALPGVGYPSQESAPPARQPVPRPHPIPSSSWNTFPPSWRPPASPAWTTQQPPPRAPEASLVPPSILQGATDPGLGSAQPPGPDGAVVSVLVPAGAGGQASCPFPFAVDERVGSLGRTPGLGSQDPAPPSCIDLV